MEMKCEKHGKTKHYHRSDSPGKYRCGKCVAEMVTKRRREVKATLVQEAGGSCVICGYSKCQQALQFHHRDPEQKMFSISVKGSSISISRLRDEAKKCALLCANCHAEVEAGVTEL